MIDLQNIGNRIATVYNMLNDLELKGGKNFRIAVYAQQNCQEILREIETELKEQNKQSVDVPLVNNTSEVTPNDNPGSTEQH